MDSSNWGSSPWPRTMSRIDLIPVQVEDLPLLLLWRNENRHFFKYTEVITKQDHQNWYDEHVAAPHTQLKLYMIGYWATDYQIQPIPVGTVGVRFHGSSAEITNVIMGSQQFRRNGIMETAIRKLIDTKVIGSNRIFLEVLSTNTAAISLYKKLGFVFESSSNGVDTMILKGFCSPPCER